MGAGIGVRNAVVQRPSNVVSTIYQKCKVSFHRSRENDVILIPNKGSDIRSSLFVISDFLVA